MNVEQLYDRLGGRSEIRSRIFKDSGGALKLSPSQMTDWARDNGIPSCWFNVVERLCMERGMECPRSLFNFKSADR